MLASVVLILLGGGLVLMAIHIEWWFDRYFAQGVQGQYEGIYWPKRKGSYSRLVELKKCKAVVGGTGMFLILGGVTSLAWHLILWLA
jgi:hypothetical protein